MVTDGGSLKRTIYIRLATQSDVPIIKRMVESLAVYERASDRCHITEASLESNLFRLPAFSGPTVFLLEIGPPLSSAAAATAKDQTDSNFEERCEQVNLYAEVADPEATTFRSPMDETRAVAGYVLFVPTFSTFVAKPGINIVDLFVREAYRRKGLGSVLLKTVAQQVTQRGWGRVEWCVLDWNQNAIKFYQKLGAIVHQEYRVCRLSGDALEDFSRG